MVIDPDSFANSVENLFHLSFLVKEGHAKISDDDTVQPYEPPLDGDFKAKRQQSIVKLDFETWRVCIKKFSIFL